MRPQCAKIPRALPLNSYRIGGRFRGPEISVHTKCHTFRGYQSGTEDQALI